MLTFQELENKNKYSYSHRMVNAINDNIDVLEIFLNYHYDNNYNIESIAKRMEKIRNDLAHCNLNIKLEFINIHDIKLVEELLYSMRLKNLGVSCNNIQKAIDSVKGYNLIQ